MPIVKPDFSSLDKQKPNVAWTPGRYVLRVVDVSESEKLDKNGCNALVFKFEAIAGTNTSVVGKKISKWVSLGGSGSRYLFRLLKTLKPDYDGGAFNTQDLLGKVIEADVIVSGGRDGKDYPSVERVFEHLKPGSVANGMPKAIADAFDDFDMV